MFIYFSFKNILISVQSSCIYDVWERWVSYRHLSSPAVTFVFNFYNENVLLSLSLSLSLSLTHTHSWVRNWHYLTCRYIWFLFLCETILLSLSHMDIYFYRSSLWSWWWIDDDKHVNTWICKCVVDLCMKIILDRCLCLLCLSFFDSDTCVLIFIIFGKII